MGFLDKLRRNAGPLAERAKDAVADNAEKVDAGIDKVADTVDGRTKGKHSDKIDSVADKAHGLVHDIETERKGR
jgi:hypothetical protein